MGWSSGSELAENLWDAVKQYIPDEEKKSVARKFIKEFENMDCDTLQEAEELWKTARSRK